MSDFILEIFSEEIPARMQKIACQKLKDFFEKELMDARLECTSISSYVTPRRLVLHIDGLPLQQADQQEEKKGPRVDAPDQAIQGFLASNQIAFEDCEHRDLGKKGVFLFAQVCVKGKQTSEVLTESANRFLTSMSWPKSMRWGAHTGFSWVRPIHHILILFDGKPLEFTPPRPGISTGSESYGHRFMAPGPFAVSGWQDYQKQLEAHKVVLETVRREELIRSGYEQKAKELKAQLPENGASQIKEVAGLVEWPVVCVGRFSERFLKVPSEILTTSMWEHQYFTPLYDAVSGELRSEFLFTANIQAPKGMEGIISGNEAVLRARLQDAQFFWETDQQQSLDTWNNHLKKQIFHEDLGAVFERVQRFEVLAKEIDPENKDLLTACQYSKADLASQMVGEFPELQGVMGGYYMALKGYNATVCQAVSCQYREDKFPNKTAALLSFIQKLEGLATFFAVGIHPTSSKDPYALRRAALGLIKIMIDQEVKVGLERLFEMVYALVKSEKKQPLEAYKQALKKFMIDRFRHLLKADFSHKSVESVLNASWFSLDFSKGYQYCSALKNILPTEKGQKIITLFDRIHSLLKASKDKNIKGLDKGVDPSLFQDSNELTVFNLIKKEQKNGLLDPKNGLLDPKNDVYEAKKGGKEKECDLDKIFDQLETFCMPLNSLFETVMIHDPNPEIERNRLSLLMDVESIFSSVLDFSKLSGN